MLAPLRGTERRDLTEVIEDRGERASTLIASQLPVTDWHAVIGDPNQADAICDHLLHDAHPIDLKSRSMRRTHDAPANGGKHRVSISILGGRPNQRRMTRLVIRAGS